MMEFLWHCFDIVEDSKANTEAAYKTAIESLTGAGTVNSVTMNTNN